MATEEMVMHDSNTTEVLSMLPPYEGKWVLKLGAVMGSFTEELAKQAAKVVVLDFFRSGINKDENINGHHRNVKFVHLSYLSVSLNSIDLIFSNLLLMHLSDEEGIHTVQRMLKWLKPEGHTLFIESCFIPSMDCKPGFYMKVFKECRMHDELGNSYELSLAGGKCIGAYRKSKKNDNQVCWLWQKIESKDTTKEFLSKLDLKPGQKVLDVGCGIGGGNFYMAETFGVEVIGIDLSTNMISLALERAVGLKLPVEFEVADCTKKVYPDNTFDVIYSRDTILHIQDKPALFRTFYKWLKPGGKVLISDYCKSAGEPSPEFAEYIKQRGYDLHDVKTYGQMLRDAGFDEVIAEDRTDQFIQVLQKELESTEKGKDRFISDFSKEDYDDIVNGWKAKLVRSTCGQQLWGLFLAKKHCRDASH